MTAMVIRKIRGEVIPKMLHIILAYHVCMAFSGFITVSIKGIISDTEQVSRKPPITIKMPSSNILYF